VKGATAAEKPRHGIGVIRGFVVLFCSFATDRASYVIRHVNKVCVPSRERTYQCIPYTISPSCMVVPWYHACKSAETLHGGKVINNCNKIKYKVIQVYQKVFFDHYHYHGDKNYTC